MLLLLIWCKYSCYWQTPIECIVSSTSKNPHGCKCPSQRSCCLLSGPRPTKRIFGHVRTAKALISLRIRAAWSVPLLSTYRIIWFYRMYELKAKARYYFAHAQKDLRRKICACCACSDTFLLGTAYMYFCVMFHRWCRGTQWRTNVRL